MSQEIKSVDIHIAQPPYDQIASFDWMMPIVVVIVGTIVISAVFTVALDVAWKGKK